MDKTIDWLMQGDPSIRWQVMRSLLNKPRGVWQAERQRTLETGWGKEFLDRQGPDGRWGNDGSRGRWGGGLYMPKWISTTYTLLTLISLGIPNNCPAGRRGARIVIDALLGKKVDEDFQQNLRTCDRCVVGMMLQIGVYFGLEDDRIEVIADNLLTEIMPDGGWNCGRHRSPEPHHSSFHTTFNVLEGLREYIETRSGTRRKKLIEAERRALELILQHRLFKSDKTGKIINPKFVLMSYPPRWHYDVLRGLDYFARANAPRDNRLGDAIDLLQAQRRPDGTWSIQYEYANKIFFRMEGVGKPSRWNTLRSMRVLQWWQSSVKSS